MTYAQLNDTLSDTLVNGGDLESLKTDWEMQIKKLHTFMEMFLERFGDRVLGEKDSSPEWRLYSAKCDAYSNYTRAVRNVDYFQAKKRLETA